MTPEELARIKIDKQLRSAGWDIVSRDEYVPGYSLAVKEALMQGNKESDYLLFIDNKAIAVVEAKKESNSLGEVVAEQAEYYATHPQFWYGLWTDGIIPLVFLANGNKLYFKNLLNPDSEYEEIKEMFSPKKMLKLLGFSSEYGALPRIEKAGLRDCQYDAEVALEASLKAGKKKSLAILATGSGKTYLACLASYRLLNYTSTSRILFLVDRNNLARQTENEFSTFNRTENGMALSNLYEIKRLKKNDDIKGDVVISTIQKLFAVLTGQQLTGEENEDAEDETNNNDNEKSKEIVTLSGDLKIPPDYFQFIIVDECHRSIYGKWKAVLNYFKDAKVLGLTATPTEEAYAFFNNNIVEKYTYEDSIVDGVNVPSRVYRIITEKTVHGGRIEKGAEIKEVRKNDGQVKELTSQQRIDYTAESLDRSVINPDQIKTVLRAYRDAIYTDLYPDRSEDWAHIPKTLIFAKNDKHADEIVEAVKSVFAECFTEKKVPESFVKKITYSAGDSNGLIRDLRIERDFRIAVTVTLVATGTDVRPLEVVLFMNDVKSEILYTQMKGRGCRTIDDGKLKEITPNAESKDCFYIVDAVGVTEHDHELPSPDPQGQKKRTLPLPLLLEQLSHNEVSDENLSLLRDYCSTINRRYVNNSLFGKHLDEFVSSFGFSPKYLAEQINRALSERLLPAFIDASHDNTERIGLISCLISNLDARNKLLELKKGYVVIVNDDMDKEIYSGFSLETARTFIQTFEQCLLDHKDSIEALRIIYNSEDTLITHSMLVDLQEKLLSFNKEYTSFYIWRNYKLIDSDGNVDDLDMKHNVNALTNLIQIARFAYKRSSSLTSLFGSAASRFNLYVGMSQRTLTEEQENVMKQIAEYIVNDGAITIQELNEVDADLWRRGTISFTPAILISEMQTLSRFILRAA